MAPISHGSTQFRVLLADNDTHQSKSPTRSTISLERNSPEETTKPVIASNWSKFQLLMWKNWLIQKRKVLLTLVEVSMPVMFALALLVIRAKTPNTTVQPQVWQSFSVDEFPSRLVPASFKACPNHTHPDVSIPACSAKWRIIYTPNNSLTAGLMATLEEHLPVKVQPLETEDQIEKEMKVDSKLRKDTLGAVVFTNLDGQSLPGTVKYKIRLKVDHYFAESGEQISWVTHQYYPTRIGLGPRYEEWADQRPGYYSEGFLTIQRYIDIGIMLSKNVTSDKVFETEVKLQKFPYPFYIYNQFIIFIQGPLPLVVMVSFIVTFPNIVKEVVLEKELKLKETMMLMGMPPILNWIAWNVKYITMLTITNTLMVIVYKLPIGDRGTIISKSNPVVLFMLLELYAVSLISSAFFLSTFFSKARNATGLSAVFFFLSYVPYTFLDNAYTRLSLSTKLAFSLLPNVAMSLGFRLMGNSEGSEGLLLTNMPARVTLDDNLTITYIFIMFAFDALFYFFLALYVEMVFPGDYGVPKPWYFLFMKSFWCPRLDHIHSSINKEEHKQALIGENMEPYRGGLKAGIRICGLHKVFKGHKFSNRVAVKNMHLDMYENQITVLLGHNGAGKSTTMLMLSGFFSPTSGTAIINNHDLTKDLKSVRQTLGLCPQHDVLFDHMTVKEHLQFFARLKGSKDSCELTEMIKQLGLESKTDSFSQDLSGGMKRKLCCGIAFVGGTKVVILDEPTSGVDPESRRQMWDILQSHRKGRTILLATHFMDEADYLGDRIAIMAEGEVICCGSRLFLKKKFGVGYHMVMVKTPGCEVPTVTEVVTTHVPLAKLESNKSSELSYILPYEGSAEFPALFSELEVKKSELGITSFGVSVTTMEEVFLKIGDMSAESENVSSTQLQRTESKPLPEYRKLTGCRLYFQQFIAMFKKRVINSVRNPVIFLVQLLVPVFFTIVGILVSDQVLKGNKDTAPLKMDLRSYEDPVILLETQNPESDYVSRLVAALEGYLSDEHEAEIQNTNNITDEIISVGDRSLRKYLLKYIVGLRITDGYVDPNGRNASALVTGYFNGEPYHGPPKTVNIIGNILYKFITDGAQGCIEVTNHPLPRLVTEKSIHSYKAHIERSFQICTFVIFGRSFLLATFVLCLVKEKSVKSKHLQFVSGAKKSIFWMSTIVWDYIIFMIPALADLIIFKVFHVEGYTADNNWILTLMLYSQCALGVLPLVYVLSFLFTVPSSGLAYCILIMIILGLWLVIIVHILKILEYTEAANILRNIFYVFFPNYCFGDSLQLLNLNYESKKICNTQIANIEDDYGYTLETFCELTKQMNGTFGCCADNCGEQCIRFQEGYLSLRPNGIGMPLCCNTFHFLVFFGMVMFLESDLSTRIWQKVVSGKSSVDDSVTFIAEDSDVESERLYIESEDIDQLKLEHPIVVRGLRKVYGSLVAVHSSNFFVKSDDCFGLLGINGAGKSTTFKMLTGDVGLTAGDAYLNGCSVTHDIDAVRNSVGYCPQFDALIDIMTVRETLDMYARLRGIPPAQVKTTVDNIMDNLSVSKYANVKTGKLSGGNRRKVSTGIALIGSPYIIFLDEPTTAMDPVARRLLWNTLTRLRDSGRTLVLTSHSMEECEALCTKIVIMVNGKFQCLGTPQHLKSKFAEGYQLTVKIKSDTDEDTINTRSERFMKFVDDTFPGSELKDYHIGYLTYIIKSAGLAWADIFKLIEEIRERYAIEDYSISQTSLEQVFLTLARGQQPPSDLENIATSTMLAKTCGFCWQCNCCRY